jgi:transcriptional regulator with XRE-family HTH domain
VKHEANGYPLAGFCERLKEARTKAGLSQKELGDKVNIARRTISYYETGYKLPTFTIISKIAAVLKVSLDWLAYGKEK